jgi:hypothetical protein
MTRAIATIAALTHAPLALPQGELLRSIFVLSCALALILAGNAMPF